MVSSSYWDKQGRKHWWNSNNHFHTCLDPLLLQWEVTDRGGCSSQQNLGHHLWACPRQVIAHLALHGEVLCTSFCCFQLGVLIKTGETDKDPILASCSPLKPSSPWLVRRTGSLYTLLSYYISLKKWSMNYLAFKKTNKNKLFEE